MYYGPEYTAQYLVDGCQQHRIELRYIQPGKPNQNAYLERSNKTYRTGVLNAYLFDDLDQVREISKQGLTGYNEERPHESLGNLPPSRYREAIERSKSSPLQLSPSRGWLRHNRQQPYQVKMMTPNATYAATLTV